MQRKEEKPTLPKEKLAEVIQDNLDVLEPVHAERVNYIIEFWGRGYRTREVVRLFKEKFQLSTAQCYRYVEEAKRDISLLLREEREEHLAKAINRMDAAIRRAYTENNLKTVIEAAKHRDALLGLVNPNGTALGNEQSESQTEEQRRESLQKILHDPSLRKAAEILLELRPNA